MSGKLHLNDGLRSQALKIIATLHDIPVRVVESPKGPYLENPNLSDFNDVLNTLNQIAPIPFLPENEEKTALDLINKSFAAAEANALDQLSSDLNELLLFQSFLVGNDISAADVCAVVALYQYFAKLKPDARFQVCNVTRWFDLVQNRVASAGVLAVLPISKEPPKAKKPKKEKKAKGGAQPKPEKPAEEEDEKKEVTEKQPKKKKAKKGGGGGGANLCDNVDSIEFIHHRVKMFEDIFQRQQKELTDRQKGMPVAITLADGTVLRDFSDTSCPMDVAKHLSKSLAKSAIVAEVNGDLWDLLRPFESDCTLKILTWDDPKGKHVFWHSSAHVLGQSLERLYKGKLTVGPALDPSQWLHNGGFYYDVDTTDLGDDLRVSEGHYQTMEKFIKKIAGEKQPFQRVVLTKAEALEMFKFNKFKQQLISEKIQDGTICTAYRCGPLIDLCRGPHIPNTGLIKALRVVKNGATFWKNDRENESLQRIYGISFPDNKKMKEWEELRKRAEESDHRILGRKQNLFFFDDLSPGSCFWLPHGARIYNKLQDFIRMCYRERGYTEVISPNVYNFKLWETSGHAANYKENMFTFEVEDQEFGLKPMNCPGHCVMYKHDIRSYRDLPLRFADFGALHRNELSGALTGLTRVRRFCQDDAHIFCTKDQIGQEVGGCLDFLNFVYSKFGFKFDVELSTRPEDKYLGSVELWDEAEKALAECLDKFVADHSELKEWKVNPGDGAFYGPKIDIKVYDSLQREHQCATIQLDFQLPLRFDMEYLSAEQKPERPVIVHRAIYGSFERFIAILTEHLGGKWPFWVSPRQVCIVPVRNEFNEYAHDVRQAVHDAGYWVDVDDSNNRLNKKIRNAQLSQYNFILVVGEKERESRTVNVRTRDNEQHGVKSVEDLLTELKGLIDNYQ